MCIASGKYFAVTPGITWTKSRQAFGVRVHALVPTRPYRQ